MTGEGVRHQHREGRPTERLSYFYLILKLLSSIYYFYSILFNIYYFYLVLKLIFPGEGVRHIDREGRAAGRLFTREDDGQPLQQRGRGVGAPHARYQEEGRTFNKTDKCKH